MLNNIREKWNFPVTDWVTSIGLIEKEFIFFGTRDGILYLVDWYNNELFQKKFSSWIGSIKLLSFNDGNLIKEYLFLGTKNGEFYIYKFDRRNLINPLSEIYSYEANNTIREIDVFFNNNDFNRIKTGYVIFGAEDRKIYLINLKDIFDDLFDDIKIDFFETNGWIRSVAFYKNYFHKILIIAGCGDKHLYFYDIGGNLVDKINVKSKVHSIITKTKVIYATSDTKKIHKIEEIDNGNFVCHDICLDYRATKLFFESKNKDNYFIVSEKENLFLYDVNDKCKSKFNFNNIYSLSIMSKNIILIGGEHSLQCFKYNIDTNSCFNYKKINTNKNLISNIEKYSMSPKENILFIGIGRFIHVINKVAGIPINLAIIGTDGGKVLLCTLDNKIKKVTEENFINSRIWSVYAYWKSTDILKVFIATSNNKILVYSLYFVYLEIDNKTKIKVFWNREDEIETIDWVREIRPVIKNKKEDYVAVTEKGDIVFYNDVDLVSHLKISHMGKIVSKNIETSKYQIFRTISCNNLGHNEYELFTGSDNNQVFYYQSNEKGIINWARYTSDRVRETHIYEDKLYAVSEDRFLYIYARDGSIISRFKFPHRALCVDIYKENGMVFIVIGCGDGHVYILHNNFIFYSYSYEDRIRDLKIIDNKTLLLVSENFYAYYEKLPNVYYKDNKLSKILFELKRKLISLENNVKIISNLNIHELFFLLEYSGHWVKSIDDYLLLIDLLETAFKYIDVQCEENNNVNIIKFYYIYSNALFQLTENENRDYQADFISKIAKYLISNTSIYISHSIISTLSYKIKYRKIDILEQKSLLRTIFKNINFSDDWIIEETLLLLYSIEYFRLSKSDYSFFFKTLKISYFKIYKIVNYILEVNDNKLYFFDNQEIINTDVFVLLKTLKKTENTDIYKVFSELKKITKERKIKKYFDFLDNMFNIDFSDRRKMILTFKKDFFSINKYLFDILNQIPLESCSLTKEEAMHELNLHISLVDLKLHSEKNKLSIEEFIDIEFYKFFVKMAYT